MPTLIRNTHCAFDWKNAAIAELSVGDEIRDTLKNGEIVTFVVVDHGVIGLKDCLREPHIINDKSNIIGCGIRFTAMRDHLNNDIFHLLPDELRSVIKPRRFVLNGEAFEDKLWLFSEVEIFGKQLWSSDDTGKQYEYFKSPAHRVKTLGGSCNAVFWWERSVFTRFSDFFCCVHPGGGAGYHPSESELGICFGFFI